MAILATLGTWAVKAKYRSKAGTSSKEIQLSKIEGAVTGLGMRFTLGTLLLSTSEDPRRREAINGPSLGGDQERDTVMQSTNSIVIRRMDEWDERVLAKR